MRLFQRKDFSDNGSFEFHSKLFPNPTENRPPGNVQILITLEEVSSPLQVEVQLWIHNGE